MRGTNIRSRGQYSGGIGGFAGAYDVELQSVETPKPEASTESDASQLIIAGKKSASHRGPARVEITYAIGSGLIQQMRFVELPYGPRRLTLMLSLVEERDLGANFFDHETHHARHRPVEYEE